MTPSILRVYDPAECSPEGVPPDWECCRACDGEGTKQPRLAFADPCLRCGGHGSLKAAALHNWRHTFTLPEMTVHIGEAMVYDPPIKIPRDVRCEDCGHPASDGTWEPTGDGPRDLSARFADIAAGRMEWAYLFDHPKFQHYSPCDEGCRHAGPLRWRRAMGEWEEPTLLGKPIPTGTSQWASSMRPFVHASWRQVDIRTMGWPHDLRPEKLAVLCTRCYAERTVT